MRCRHRLSKMLLRRGLIYSGRQAAGARPTGSGWELCGSKIRVDQAVFDDYLLAIDQLEERLKALSQKLEEVSREAPYAEPVAALRCFRGIDTVTAMTIVAELHTFGRFTSPRGLMAFLGLVPSEHSSGDEQTPGRHHQGRQQPRAPCPGRGGVELPPPTWHSRAEEAAGGTAAASDRASRTARCSGLYRRYSRMTSARHSRRPRPQWRSRASWSASSGRRCIRMSTPAGELTSARAAFHRDRTCFRRPETADEDRHDSEDTRAHYATARRAGLATLDSVTSRRSTVMRLYADSSAQPANIRVTRRRSALSRPSSRVPGGGTRSDTLPTATASPSRLDRGAFHIRASAGRGRPCS